MAKAPDTIERFRIHADTSQERVGGILAVLTKLGVDNIGFEIITDVASFRHNGARKDHGSTSQSLAAPAKSKRSATHARYDVSNRDMVQKFVGRRQKFGIGELTAYFEQENRPKQSATSVVSKMTAEGAFKKIGDGQYEVLKNGKAAANG